MIQFKHYFFSGCGGSLNAPDGEITSFGYPRTQLFHQLCTWDITVSIGRRIKVEFIDFDIAGSRPQESCIDELIVYKKLLKHRLQALFIYLY